MTDVLDALDRGATLPSGWYTDDSFYAAEAERVMRRSWHFVAHTAELPAVGDQAPYEIAGVPIALVRDESGDVRGFVNICRHRAHVVVLEPRNRKALFCSYHGWSYGLDGQVKHIPRGEEVPALDRRDCSLVPVQVYVWGPTIWVNLALDAPSFDEWTGSLKTMVSERGVDVDRHVYGFERTWDIAANWKVFMDNAIECYHCPTAHPELSRVLEMDPATQTSLIGGRYWVSHSIPFRDDPARIYHFHWIFPTTYFQYAGAGFDVGTLQPLGPQRTRFRHLTFVPLDMAPDDVAARRERLVSDPTIPQDVGICERVQRAHASGAAPSGHLLGHSEMFVAHFQRVVAEDVVGAPHDR
jgi:choline monooxygenase